MGLFYSKPAAKPSLIYNKEFLTSLPDFTGKNVVITGTSLGSLGYVITEACLEKNANVYCLNRDMKKAQETKDSLVKTNPSFDSRINLIKCDLVDFDSIRQAAQEVKSNVDKVDILCNNAGVMMLPG